MFFATQNSTMGRNLGVEKIFSSRLLLCLTINSSMLNVKV